MKDVPQPTQEQWDQMDPNWKEKLDDAIIRALIESGDISDEDLAQFLDEP